VFLRSLTIRGFKSFADRTTLEFAPGVSVIVGPNGSGKSNIADAIAWVLGEQGPRALRGAQMADVIYAGSPSRQALGMCEVSLVIDNSAGLIPIPAAEIEISRAIYRSGESEYRLGGRPCRLLDIQEALSDSGIGRALHTVIGQGSLDDVLGARPEERRQFIEEAAGIAKHRRRRERAERKLQGMEGDLVRLQDLVAELRRRLKPLKQQAELAERHDALTREADSLARRLAAARLRSLLEERDLRRPRWERAEARRTQARARLEALDADIARLDAERHRAEEARAGAEAAANAAASAKSDAEAVLRSAYRDEALAQERLATATNRAGRLFALEDELARTEQALHDVQAALAEREPSLAQAELAFHRAERARRDAEEDRRRMAEEAAGRRAEAEAARRAAEAAGAERERLGEAVAAVGARIAEVQAQAEELDREVERLDAVAGPLGRELADLERERVELSRTLAGLEAEERGLLARQESVEARRRELAESPGAAFARRRGDRPLGVLRELIEAPPHLATALRAALGPFADAVVYADDEEVLREARSADGTGVVLASGHPAGPLDTAPADAAEARGERSLLDAVRPDPRVSALVARLLGRTYPVRNLAEAVARHRVVPGASFVTPEGTVVGPAFVRAASGQDARLEGVRRESAGLDRELAATRRGLREARGRTAEIERRIAAVAPGLEEADAGITAAAERMASVRSELASLRREEQLVSERAAAAAAEAESTRRRLSAIPAAPAEPPVLPAAPEPPVQLRVEVEALRRERARLDTGVARARTEVAALSAEDPVALREVLRAAEAARAAAEEALRAAEDALGPAVAAYREAAEAAGAADRAHAEANRAWREAASELDRIGRDHDEEDRARADLERRVADATAVLVQGHGVRAEEALRELEPDDTVEELQHRSDLVARRLGLLGRVNLLASGELESLQERHDFLVRELDDVRAARRDLERLIAEADLRMAELFETAFRDVAAEFSALFSALFPGGEGRLTLLDPGDPLTSGIEVEARPGRKRVKRLSLLSGGERALAALAFLFAIFRARPSPFYLMDEVEAALDDVNLQRFLDIVREFSSTSQVLVVTHQKRTMEMADVLYGISMGRDGASRVLSQRLAEVSAG
jgi:chromosome segregation protein